MARNILAVDDEVFILDLVSRIAAKAEHTEAATEPPQDGTQLMKAEADRPFDCLLIVVDVPGKRAVDLYAGPHISGISGKQLKLVLTAMDKQAFVYRVLGRASADHAIWPSNDRALHSHTELQTAARTAIETTRRHILENPRQDLDLRALAEVAGVSPRHLSRLFRAETGMSPAAYVEQTRITIARQLLEGTTDPIKAVTRCARSCVRRCVHGGQRR